MVHQLLVSPSIIDQILKLDETKNRNICLLIMPTTYMFKLQPCDVIL
jgi:hypothetical protein